MATAVLHVKRIGVYFLTEIVPDKGRIFDRDRPKIGTKEKEKSMEEEKKETIPEPLSDPKRASYMIAWRDRHIEKQNEMIAGYEEQVSMMEALLAFALWKRASEMGAERTVIIPKEELKMALSQYTSEVQSDGEAFTVRFLPRKTEPQDGGEQQVP